MTGDGVFRDRVLARSFLRAAASSNSPDANAIEARTLAGQLLVKLDSDEQAERQKAIDDRLARERSDREQEQRRLADLDRAQRERVAQANRIAAAYFSPRRTAFQSEGGHDFKLMADSVSDDRGHRFKVKADSISS